MHVRFDRLRSVAHRIRLRWSLELREHQQTRRHDQYPLNYLQQSGFHATISSTRLSSRRTNSSATSLRPSSEFPSYREPNFLAALHATGPTSRGPTSTRSEERRVGKECS